MKIARHLPNLLTILNLFFGCLALVAITGSEYQSVFIFTVIALVFDFSDGMAARLLHVKTAIGKDLDSLADVVSFGLVPGYVMFHLISKTVAYQHGSIFLSILAYCGFLITLFSALRLAKFNTDSRQSDSFIGLPTPANALFIVVLPLLSGSQSNQHLLASFFETIGNSAGILTGISMLSSYLLVSEINMISLKFSSIQWRNNEPRYLLLGGSVILILMLGLSGIPFVIIYYIILSGITSVLKNWHKNSRLSS